MTTLFAVPGVCPGPSHPEYIPTGWLGRESVGFRTSS